MGIMKQMARFIIREAKYSPIRGSVLMIGRQTIHLTPLQFTTLMLEEGMPINPNAPLTLDTTTRRGANRGYVSDAYFFKALGAEKVSAIDLSDYEGAEIIHNLDSPIPPHLQEKFDFICNGSVLDNEFNPISGLQNISRMLASRGRVIHFEHASNTVNNAYLQFSPNWFFDYYVVNRFNDCKTYLALFFDLNGPWEYYACLHPNGKDPRLFRSSRFAMTMVIAEKASDSTWDRLPIQGHYRGREDWARYLECMRRFANSPRPVISPSRHGLFSFVARVRGYAHETAEFFRLVRHGPQTPKQTVIEAIMSLLPPGYFAEKRGYLPLGKFY